MARTKNNVSPNLSLRYRLRHLNKRHCKRPRCTTLKRLNLQKHHTNDESQNHKLLDIPSKQENNQLCFSIMQDLEKL